MKWKIVHISLLTFLTLLGLNWMLNVNCPQTETFTGDSLYLFVKSLVLFLVGGLIWTVGYLLFRKFNNAPQLVKKYFILLTVLASFSLVHSIWTSTFSSDKRLIQSICNKSSDDGMFCTMNRLSFDEYMYLQKKSGWLPQMPSHCENVILNYYRDDFLGDYFLNIWVELPIYPKFDSTQFPQWKKAEITEENGLGRRRIDSDERPFGENTYYYSMSSDD